jgi:hypothetical protein
MRFILFIAVVAGCSRNVTPVTPVAPPAPTTTASATCAPDEPTPAPAPEIHKPALQMFGVDACR